MATASQNRAPAWPVAYRNAKRFRPSEEDVETDEFSVINAPTQLDLTGRSIFAKRLDRPRCPLVATHNSLPLDGYP
jgi:hypothetical protein